MQKSGINNWVSLDVAEPIWSHFFTVAPLVVIGTKEGDQYNMAPKHMVTALGHDNYFGFVCTPDHATYHNAKKEKAFSVSFVQPNQVLLASLAARPRCGEANDNNDIVHALPTVKASCIDALFIEEAYLYLECKLDRIVDGFGKFSLIAGEIIAAHVHPDALRVSEGDDGEMIHKSPLLAYLPYGRFAEIQRTQRFPFPKDFKQDVLIEP